MSQGIPKENQVNNKIALSLPLILLSTLTALPSSALTRINFAKGSYCSAYSGQDNKLVLNLGKGQILDVRLNEWDDSIIAINTPSGYRLPRSPGRGRWRLPESGDYILTVLDSQSVDVRICAY